MWGCAGLNGVVRDCMALCGYTQMCPAPPAMPPPPPHPTTLPRGQLLQELPAHLRGEVVGQVLLKHHPVSSELGPCN